MIRRTLSRQVFSLPKLTVLTAHKHLNTPQMRSYGSGKIQMNTANVDHTIPDCSVTPTYTHSNVRKQMKINRKQMKMYRKNKSWYLVYNEQKK